MLGRDKRLLYHIISSFVLPAIHANIKLCAKSITQLKRLRMHEVDLKPELKCDRMGNSTITIQFDSG